MGGRLAQHRLPAAGLEASDDGGWRGFRTAVGGHRTAWRDAYHSASHPADSDLEFHHPDRIREACRFFAIHALNPAFSMFFPADPQIAKGDDEQLWRRGSSTTSSESLFTISRARAEQGENGQGSGVYTQ